MPYVEPAGINPASVGSSITPVSGWSPMVIDGTIKWHQWPALAEAGNLHYGRLGGLYGMLRYGNGQWVGIGGGAYGGAPPYNSPSRATTTCASAFASRGRRASCAESSCGSCV